MDPIDPDIAKTIDEIDFFRKLRFASSSCRNQRVAYNWGNEHLELSTEAGELSRRVAENTPQCLVKS